MSGGVIISRALFDHPAFKAEPFTEREAWLWLIMEASWKSRIKRVGNTVATAERGQLVTSVRFAATAWNWTPAKAQRFLKRLEKMEMICSETDTGVNIITICNYDKFQQSSKASDTAAIQQRYSSDTNENKGVIREEGNKKNIGDFQAFWDAVPAKVGRATAEKAYAKAVKVAAPELILSAMKAYAASRAGQDAKFTAHPATWLNGGRWEDEAPKAAKPATPVEGSKMFRKSDGAEMIYTPFDGWVRYHG